jgi:hypothetical protein
LGHFRQTQYQIKYVLTVIAKTALKHSTFYILTHTIQLQNTSITLNEQQYKIVTCAIQNNIRILASAGSGKTTTITAKIAYMIDVLGIDPAAILLTTFTHNAAEHMRAKVTAHVGETRTPKMIGTFHSLAMRIAPPDEIYHVDELPFKLYDYMNTAAGAKWAGGFHYVFVDEFQDVNEIQYKIVKRFRELGAYVTIVGDDAQNLYTWRGSSVEYILQFEAFFVPLLDFQLAVNYRSTQAIVNCANDIMRKIPTLSHKELMCVPADVDVDVDVTIPQLHHFSRFKAEKDWICKYVRDTAVHTPLHEIAILCKYNTILYQIEEQLLRAGIQCCLLSKRNTNTQPAVVLATYHAAKGLEWDHVIMMGVNDDFFPQTKTRDGVLQERRLFYVGVTRAKCHLHFTYSGDVRRLSRFVREIQRQHITYTAITTYVFSDKSCVRTRHTVHDLVQTLDGEDYITLKSADVLPPLKFKQHSYYPGEEVFLQPNWVTDRNISTEFGNFIECLLHRMMGRVAMSGGYTYALAQTSIYSIRVGKDDWAVYSKYEAMFPVLIGHVFGTVVNSCLPQPHFENIKIFLNSRYPYIEHKDMVRIVEILFKVRSVLSRLRPGQQISDFTFTCESYCVPSDMRQQLITSYARYMDANLSWREILFDIWQVSCCKSVAIGRNAVFYKGITETHLRECMPFYNMLDKVVDDWIHNCKRFSGAFLCNPYLYNEIMSGHVNMMAGLGTTLIHIDTTSTSTSAISSSSSSLSMEIITKMLCYVHLARDMGYNVKTFVIFDPFRGHWNEMSVEGWCCGETLQKYLEPVAD